MKAEQAVADFFDRCAREGWMTDFLPEEARRIPEFLAQWQIQPGEKVLEPGCGAGRLTPFLAEAVGPTGEVLGLDVSAEMVEKGRQRHLPEWVRLELASAYAIPAGPDYFDKVLCFCVFPHLEQREKALGEMGRVLKPGGEIWLNHFKDRAGLSRHHQLAGSAVFHHCLPGNGAMTRLFERCGFSVILLEDRETGYCLHARKKKGL